MRLGRAASMLVVALVATTSAACAADEAPRQLAGYRLDPPPQVGDLSLPDAVTDEPVFMRARPDGLMVMYFGFTSCPDVCPTTLAALRAALRKIGDDASRVQLAMATVDPGRDTASILPGYVQSFVPSGTAMRTDDDSELQAVADRFGASYSVTTNEEGVIEVTHSGAMYVIDEDGFVVDTLPFGVTTADIANDLSLLLDEVDR